MHAGLVHQAKEENEGFSHWGNGSMSIDEKVREAAEAITRINGARGSVRHSLQLPVIFILQLARRWREMSP